MLPGVVAGHYRLEQAQIDLAGLVDRAYGEFTRGSAIAVDAERRKIILADGAEVPYDIASLNVGALSGLSIPGSAEHGLPVKPMDEFVERLQQSEVRSAAVVGAGAAGVELAMALRYRGVPAVSIYSDRPALPPPLAGRVTAALRRTGVSFIAMPVSSLQPGPVVIAGGSEARYDAVLLATGAAAPWWLRESGLATDEHGFVLVGRDLASVSHPEVFAVGDCASLEGAPQPKSGVQSVREAPVLAHNLRSFFDGRARVPYRPQPHALQLISCGARYAIAHRGAWTAEGRWVWYWKDWIDRRWIRRFRAPVR
jgi:NADH dehydrogenase FAD-containing subunit